MARTAAGVRREVALEPLHRLGVEVVGGLVEEQQVGLLEEQLAQRHPAPLATREVVDERVTGRATECVHRLVEPAVEVPGAGVVEVGLEVAHLREQLVVVGLGVAELLGDLVEPVELGLDVVHGLLDVLEDGPSLGQRWLLLEHADGRAGVDDRVAVVGVVEPRHDLEERRLAGAVGADDADLRSVQEREGDVVEHDLVAVGLAHVAQGEDIVRHGRGAYGARPHETDSGVAASLGVTARRPTRVAEKRGDRARTDSGRCGLHGVRPGEVDPAVPDGVPPGRLARPRRGSRAGRTHQGVRRVVAGPPGRRPGGLRPRRADQDVPLRTSPAQQQRAAGRRHTGTAAAPARPRRPARPDGGAGRARAGRPRGGGAAVLGGPQRRPDRHRPRPERGRRQEPQPPGTARPARAARPNRHPDRTGAHDDVHRRARPRRRRPARADGARRRRPRARRRSASAPALSPSAAGRAAGTASAPHSSRPPPSPPSSLPCPGWRNPPPRTTPPAITALPRRARKRTNRPRRRPRAGGTGPPTRCSASWTTCCHRERS